MVGPGGAGRAVPSYHRRVPDRIATLLRRCAAYRTGRSLMRRLAIAAILTNAGIVVTGGVVRLSNSGLGCPNWPECDDNRLIPGGMNPHGLVHQSIEFGNRTLIVLVLGAAIAAFLGAWRMADRNRAVVAIAALLPLGVIAQAVLGGISVRERLNPLVVAPHFLLSMVLVYISVWLYTRVGEGDGPPQRLVRREIQLGTRMLVGVVAVVEVVGTLVTATGPHAGDPGTRRLDWDPRMVTQFHADLVFLYVGLVVALLLGMKATAAPATVRRRTWEVVVVVVVQAVIGYVQYFTHVPAVLVGFHMAGATLATIVTARLFFSTRTRPVTTRGAAAERPVRPAVADLPTANAVPGPS